MSGSDARYDEATALIVVDLQNDYLASPGLEPAAGPLIRRAGALLDGWRELGGTVVHVWTTVSRSDDRRMPHWKREGRWLCEEGTRGHEPPARLSPRDGEPVVHKTSFSASPGAELDRLLSGARDDVVVVAGVAAQLADGEREQRQRTRHASRSPLASG